MRDEDRLICSIDLLQSSFRKDVMNCVRVPVRQIGGNHICLCIAQSLFGDCVGDAERAHSCRAPRLYAGRRIFYDETLLWEERKLASIAAHLVQTL